MEAGGLTVDQHEELEWTEDESDKAVGMDDYQSDFATKVEIGEAEELLRMLV